MKEFLPFIVMIVFVVLVIISLDYIKYNSVKKYYNDMQFTEYLLLKENIRIVPLEKS